MGAADSKQKLGERVIAAKRKLEDDLHLQSNRADILMAKSPQSMKFILSSIEASFDKFAPFLEPTLLIAWRADKEKCEDIVVKACKKVLSAPIQPDEYAWFQQYVLPSSIWMLKTKGNRYMFEELMAIAQSASKDIIESMDSVFAHLRKHDKWQQLLAIKEETLVSRQDDEKVGLLRDEGIVGVAEMKDDNADEMVKLQTFLDGHAAINALTVAAKTIDREFQNYVSTMMGRWGSFKAAPMKKVERCLSKLENDYQGAQYPKSAKLLDLVRCSVTFNTLEQLIGGFNALKNHVDSPQQTMKLARVKNGFLDSTYDGGYRDIKVNVIFHSAMHPEIKMICEIQLVLSQFLNEKKRIHKLYSIAREEMFFQMVVAAKAQKEVDVKKLQFEQVLRATTDVKAMDSGRGKSSIDSASGLLAIEDNNKQFLVYNMDQKEVVFQHALSFKGYTELTHQGHSHEWLEWQGKKHVSVQTELHVVKTFAVDDGFAEVEKLRISLNETDEINCCAFGKQSKRIFMVKNKNLVEVRGLHDVNTVTKSIKLEEAISASNLNPMSVTEDGAWCAIGGGQNKKHFYLIDIEKGVQYKLMTTTLGFGHGKGGVLTCFINGKADYIAVSGAQGKFEVWDVKTQKAIKFLESTKKASVTCLASKNNILAIGVGGSGKVVNLWDVGDWKMFHEERIKSEPTSIHLSEDSKYLTVSGWGADKCLVYKTNADSL